MSDVNDAWARFEKDEGDEFEKAWLMTRAASGEPESLTDPFTTAVGFLSALQNLDGGGVELLERVITPESRPAWGDFREAAEHLASLGQWGLGTEPKRALGADDVAYTALLPEVTVGFRSTAEQLVPTAALITSVWRPEHGLWMVHGFGDAIPPEHLPRTSPGQAPA